MEMLISFLLGVASSIVAAAIWAFFGKKGLLHFSFSRVLKDILKLRKILEADNYKPDLIVGIDRSGSIVASILAGHLGLASILSAHTKTTRKQDGSREISLSEPHSPRDGSLLGKSILLIACFVDTGKTAEALYQYYSSRSDKPDVRFAALYTSPAPILKPRYAVYIFGGSIGVPITRIMRRMPWMSKEWKFSLANER